MAEPKIFEKKQPQKSDPELGMFTKFFEKICAQVAEIITSVRRVSHYVAPPEDALIAYPSTTVTVATPVKPGNPDIIATGGAAGYDRVLIFFNGQRISDKVWVICDGPGSLFVLASYDLIKWSGEDEIKPGEARAFTTAYELRVRSPISTTTYRLTEYEPILDHAIPAVAAVNIAQQGANQVIAAPGAGLRIRVVGLLLVATGAVTVTLQSAGNALTGAMSMPANGIIDTITDHFPLIMNTNEAFNITLSGGVQVSGFALYTVES